MLEDNQALVNDQFMKALIGLVAQVVRLLNKATLRQRRLAKN